MDFIALLHGGARRILSDWINKGLHMQVSAPSVAPPSAVVATLLPIVAVVFVAYLVIGFAMPVLPLHVHQDLGLASPALGLVAGEAGLAAVFLAATLAVLCAAAFAVALFSRRRPAA